MSTEKVHSQQKVGSPHEAASHSSGLLWTHPGQLSHAGLPSLVQDGFSSSARISRGPEAITDYDVL